MCKSSGLDSQGRLGKCERTGMSVHVMNRGQRGIFWIGIEFYVPFKSCTRAESPVGQNPGDP